MVPTLPSLQMWLFYMPSGELADVARLHVAAKFRDCQPCSLSVTLGTAIRSEEGQLLAFVRIGFFPHSPCKLGEQVGTQSRGLATLQTQR